MNDKTKNKIEKRELEILKKRKNELVPVILSNIRDPDSRLGCISFTALCSDINEYTWEEDLKMLTVLDKLPKEGSFVYYLKNWVDYEFYTKINFIVNPSAREILRIRKVMNK